MSSAALSLPAYRFTVQQYHQMLAAGVFKEHDRVQLIEGRIVPKVTHNPPHDESVWRTQTAFLPMIGPNWIVRVQSAITTDDSEPEPDITVARRKPSGYIQSHPRPRDIGMLIETADSTLEDDRDQARVYARARIPIYWIVNLVDRQVEVHSQPRVGKTPSYRSFRVYQEGEAVPVVHGGRKFGAVRVEDLLP